MIFMPRAPSAAVSSLIYGGVTFGLPDATFAAGRVAMGCRPLPWMPRVVASRIFAINSVSLGSSTPPTSHMINRFFRNLSLPPESTLLPYLPKVSKDGIPFLFVLAFFAYLWQCRRKNTSTEPQLVIRREGGTGPRNAHVATRPRLYCERVVTWLPPGPLRYPGGICAYCP